jgi:endonuclease/exonuclease/phosphatase family metal-dependent hydrolase
MNAVRSKHAGSLVAFAPMLLVAGYAAMTQAADPQKGTLRTPLDAKALFLRGPDVFRVYTRNIYVGGDTGPLFSLDFGDTPVVVARAVAFWGEVQSSDFPDRAATIADEIARTNPHVIGLQEVADYVLLDRRFQPTERLDMLRILESALKARGLSYHLVLEQVNTSGTLPLSLDAGAPGAPTRDRYLRFTVREATLVRGDLPVVERDGGNYRAVLDLGALTLMRGWSRVTVDFEGVPFHVINTHLETQNMRRVHDAQAAELLGSVTAGLDGVTIVVGDLNSDAAAGEGDPSWTPTYGRLTGNGFVDAWDERRFRRFGRQGFTCCHDPDLMNGPSTLDQRLDFILVRTRGEPLIGDGLPGVVAVDILGDEQWERTSTDLWPGDHAALSAGLRLPYGRLRAR